MEKPLVAVRCITYNQEKYIGRALEGFVTQKTNFRFIAIVHDDASTDSTPRIIQEYAEKYPEIIHPILEEENQYSKPGNPLRKIMEDAVHATGAKYVAYCEGDDYWVDSHKLQRQVDFLEANPDYSLCVTNYLERTGDKDVPSRWNVEEDCDVSMEQVILNGGLFIASASIMGRLEYVDKLPEETKKLHVGDYPLQIYMRYLGKVRWLAKNTTVYRLNAIGSWTSKNTERILDSTFIQKQIQKESYLLDTMNRLTGYKFSNIFRKRKNLYIFNSSFYTSGFKCLLCFLKSPLLIYRQSTHKQKGIKWLIFSSLPKSLKRKYVLKPRIGK